MATFMVRVELHGANWQDYEVLHEAMGREGFKRTVVGSDGQTYQLPTAEYGLDGSYTRAVVLEKAKRAAAKTGKRFGVIVTESIGRVWFGLEVVKKKVG